MVQASTYYIDSTEVTVAEYQVFLAAKGSDTSGQPAVCAWNTSYHDPAVAFSPGTWPMTNVDWCDALAYCTWAGEHLCGKIGGGSIASADLFTSSKSQWYQACGGGTFDVNANPTCNTSGGNNDLAPVASFTGCEGYYPGLFDMEGNAAEWVDSCDSTDAGAADVCYLIGGSYLQNTPDCADSDNAPRNDTGHPIGFRCCGG
jgi:formylglycine-generating enzyme required for sulfatase activity